MLSKSRIFLLFLLSFIFGVAITAYFSFSPLEILTILVIAVILVTVWWKNIMARTVGCCGLFLLIGVGRMIVAQMVDDHNELRAYNEQGAIVFIATVVAEPDVREDHTKLTVAGEEIIRGAEHQSVAGKVLVTIPRYPEFVYGDRLQITGKLKNPGEFANFSYRDYLAQFGIHAVCYRPEVEKIASSHRFYLQRVLFAGKRNFAAQIDRLFPEPAAALLAGMLLGNKRGIPTEWQERINLVGVSHIVVISGFHVTVIAGLLVNFGLALGLSRRQTFWLAGIGLGLFVLLAGALASAARAAVMGGLVLLARSTGRMANPRNALLLAVAVIIFANPLVLRFDIGFQLSFLATVGLLYLSPLLRSALKILPRRWQIRDSVALTIAAQLLTWPVIVRNFSRLSVVAPLANILIVPVVPLTMLTGFIAGLAAFFSFILGRIIAWGAWLLLSYQLLIVEWLAKIPGAAVTINHWWWGGSAAYYVLLAILVFYWRKRYKCSVTNY